MLPGMAAMGAGPGAGVLGAEFQRLRGHVKPSEALRTHRDAILKAVDARKACNARVFGSVLRGEDHEGSDLDILVDTLPGASLFDLGGLQVDLEELLGVQVDLVTPGDLPEKLRNYVLKEARKI